MKLEPLSASHSDLLTSLQLQDDVWEFIGNLPVPEEGRADHLFAIMEGQVSLGFAGLIRSNAAGGNDFELLCAMRSEAQLHGIARHACQLVLDWGFTTANLERVIACIDDGNEAARAIAAKLGMTALGSRPPNRTVYVKYRDERSPVST